MELDGRSSLYDLAPPSRPSPARGGRSPIIEPPREPQSLPRERSANARWGLLRDLVRAKNYVVSRHAADSATRKQMRPSTSSMAGPLKAVKQKNDDRHVASLARSSSSPSTSSEPCAYCGSSKLHHRLVTRSYGKGEGLLVIERIPSISCGNCGESYFTASTMHEIERVKAHRKSLAVERPVAVVAFA